MDITEIKSLLVRQELEIQEIYKTLNIQTSKEKLEELERLTVQDGFWNDSKNSAKVLKDIKEIKQIVASYESVYNLFEEAKVYYELACETNAEEILKETSKSLNVLLKEVEKLKISSLLNEEYDSLNALVTIHAGAGGTESQDWAQMLLRMYQKWCDKAGYTLNIYDIFEGEEAGIKSVTFEVAGMHAYGYLKAEKGVHRLVRISPFDANKRRHTSFAAVDVMPQIDDSISVDIKTEDLEVDTYRASGAGGQHVNKTESAVRIKHVPTGIVVSCQTERSQIQNRETCLRMLKSKLYQYELTKTQEKLKEIKGELSENGWGSQIRSYVFCPYTLVKDHRTGTEVGNVSAVMDGDIDEFIYAYLKM